MAKYLDYTGLSSLWAKIKALINGKQDAPSTAGTAGQVLGLDSNLEPVWTVIPDGDFIVTLTIDENTGDYVADKTYAEIASAVANGKSPVLFNADSGDLYPYINTSNRWADRYTAHGFVNIFVSYSIIYEEGFCICSNNSILDINHNYSYSRVTLNGSAGVNASFYAPTTSGTSGQLAVSSGENENPTWVSFCTEAEIQEMLAANGLAATVIDGYEEYDSESGGGTT